jgi:hypothetical protein
MEVFDSYDVCEECGWFNSHSIYEKICPDCGCRNFESEVIAKEISLSIWNKPSTWGKKKLVRRKEK